jgi:hypothetical protein
VSSSEKYVAAAYIVVFLVVLAWLAIVATKLVRLEREVDEAAARTPMSPDESGIG